MQSVEQERAGSSKKRDLNGMNNVDNETSDYRQVQRNATNGIQEWRATPPDRLRLSNGMVVG
jgi:hypothetical protein